MKEQDILHSLDLLLRALRQLILQHGHALSLQPLNFLLTKAPFLMMLRFRNMRICGIRELF